MPRSFGTTNAQRWPTAPAVGMAGDLYFNTTSNALFVSDGTTWVQAGPGVPAGGTQGQVLTRTDPGTGIGWATPAAGGVLGFATYTSSETTSILASTNASNWTNMTGWALSLAAGVTVNNPVTLDAPTGTFTINTNGLYLIYVTVNFAAGATGYRAIRLGQTPMPNAFVPSSGAFVHPVVLTATERWTAGAGFNVGLAQGAAAAVALAPSGNVAGASTHRIIITRLY